MTASHPASRIHAESSHIHEQLLPLRSYKRQGGMVHSQRSIKPQLVTTMAKHLFIIFVLCALVSLLEPPRQVGSDQLFLVWFTIRYSSGARTY